MLKCANCTRIFWSGEAIFNSKYGYHRYICQKCSERENMGEIEITVKINGKQVPLENISTETFEAVRALEKPKEIPVPVARVGHYKDSPGDRRLFLKLTDSIRTNAANRNIDVIAIALQHGAVNNLWKESDEADNLHLYENIQPL